MKSGDRVLISCITACGSCRFCREGSYGQCLGGGGWILGHRIDGTQAEFVRVPFADNSTYPAPAGVGDEQLLMLADILPTGYEVGVLNGKVEPGDVVAVVGAGPIGLAAILGAKLYSPVTSSRSTSPRADSMLPSNSVLISPSTTATQDAKAMIAEMTGGLGADVAIEAVGVPATFELSAHWSGPEAGWPTLGSMGNPPPST